MGFLRSEPPTAAPSTTIQSAPTVAPSELDTESSFTDRLKKYASSDAYEAQVKALMEPPKGVQGDMVRPVNPPSDNPSGYRQSPEPKSKRLLTSDDYTQLVLEAMRLKSQARVTKMSSPRISGLLG